MHTQELHESNLKHSLIPVKDQDLITSETRKPEKKKNPKGGGGLHSYLPHNLALNMTSVEIYSTYSAYSAKKST